MSSRLVVLLCSLIGLHAMFLSSSSKSMQSSDESNEMTGFAESQDSDAFFSTMTSFLKQKNESTAEFSAVFRPNDGCGPRIRRPWHNLSQDDKDLYLDAVELSLQKKYNVYFTALHMDSMTSIEAHDTCGFLVWHRTFNLAYENMLRSLGPRFKCITIPYWDFFRDYAKMMQGECSSMEECSEFLRAIGGGGRNATAREVSIRDRTFHSGCCTTRPCNSFCESLESCSGCIPRGNWLNTTFAPTMDYSSIVATLLSAKNYEKANKRIQRGVHNDFHDVAGSAFTSYASTSDPLFYPFHATIDMLHLIYYKCGKKREKIGFFSGKKKITSHDFVKCSYHKNAKGPRARSDVMLWLEEKGKHLQVLEHPILGQFFRGIGTQYQHLLDPTDLGDFSYDYEMNHFVRVLMDKGLKCHHPKWRRYRRRHRKLTQQTIIDRDPTQEYWNWYEAAHDHVMEQVDRDFVKTAVDLEAMTCSAYNERFSERQDFSQAFKDNMDMHMGFNLPRCRSILNRIASGKTLLQNDWKQVVQPFLDH